MTVAAMAFAVNASATTIVVTDDFGSPIQGATVTVTPVGLASSEMAANVVPAPVQASEMRNGGYLVNGVSGAVVIELQHPAYGSVFAKADLSNATVELVVGANGEGFSMRHFGQPAAVSSATGDQSNVGGATCATATVIPWATIVTPAGYTDSGTTFSPGTQPVSCGLNGSDAFYTFTAATSEDLCLTTCLAASPADTVLQVKNGICGTTVACNDDNCPAPRPAGANVNGFNSTLNNVPVVAGQTYTIQIDNWASTAPGAYSLNVKKCPQLAACPAGGIPEGEPNCGLTPPPQCAPADNTNGGCNSNPPVFSNIACGQTVCGTAGACGVARDTDWYQVVETSIRVQTWCCTAEFTELIGLVNNAGGSGQCPATAFQAFTTRPPFVQGCVTQLLFPGTWWWFIAPAGFGGVPCGADYQCTLSCVCPASCGGATGGTEPTNFDGGDSARLR